MHRSHRTLTAGVTALVLLMGMSPAVAADESASTDEAASRQGASPSAEALAAAEGVLDPAEVGVEVDTELLDSVEDVTDTDESLRATRNEVSVLVDNGTDAPTVTKLRTETASQAEELAAALDAQPGVVAAETTRLRAFDTSTPSTPPVDPGPVDPAPVAPAPIVPDPMFGAQWNMPAVGVPDAWSSSFGAGVVVAVIDTGVDAAHPDLAGRVLPEIDLLPEVTPAPEQNAHGTRVASLIAGGLDGIGMTGVAPQSGILPVSALDPAGFGDSSTVARAIIAAADAGARVINLSLGGPDPDPILDEACAYAFAKGAVVVAAGGNSYASGNSVQYPAASAHVLGVASTDGAGNPSAFSNTGPHIDLAAPGEAILAAIPGAGYSTESGTSFSAPHVSGAAALVLSANPNLSAAEAASVLQSTALDDLSGNGRDDQLGNGIVRADFAVTAALTITASGIPSDAKLRLRRFNARGEPARRGELTTFTAILQARHPDGSWRRAPVPTSVKIQFRRAGKKSKRKYRTRAIVTSDGNGHVELRAVPKRNGRWRARVQQPNGRWTNSRSDFLRVRR